MKTETESTTSRGLFWRPEAEEPKLTGQLTYGTATGASLELYGSFGEPWSGDPRTIWGITVAGTAVTLFDAYLENQTSGFTTGDATCHYVSYVAALGGHYQSPEEITACHARISIERLNNWARLSGSLRPTRRSDGTTIIELHDTDPFPLGSHEDVAIALEPIRQESWTIGQVSIREDCILTFTSRQARSFTAFAKMASEFQQFLALCTGMLHNVTSFWLAAQPAAQGVVAPSRGVQVVQKVFGLDGVIRKRFPPGKYLASLMPGAAEYVSAFYRKLSTIKPACDLWYTTIAGPHLYLEQYFLVLAFALESAHRPLIGGQYMPKEEFLATLYKRLVDAIPTDGLEQQFRESIKNRLQYLNQLAFHRRVREICERVKEVAEPLKAAGTSFSRRVSEVRNTLVHDGTLGEVSPEEVIKLSDRMSAVVQAVLLKEAGIADERLRTLVLTGKESLMA